MIAAIRTQRKWTAWVLTSAGLVFLVMLVLFGLWAVMPPWFRLAVIAYAPGIDLVYRAAEADGGDGGLESALRERFPPAVLLEKSADRIEHGNAEQRRYAARCIGWIFWRQDPPRGFVLDDPVLRQRLIDGLLAVSRGSEPGCVDTACFALLEMGEVHRLPEILRILDHRGGKRWFSLNSFRRHTAETLVTTHMLKWFHARPDYNTLKCLMKQDDPRVEDLIIAVMRTPTYSASVRRLGLSSARPPSPAYLSAVRALCADKDENLRSQALHILRETDEALAWMLDVRVDPTTRPVHRDAEHYLMEHAEGLSIEQGYRWISAPSLPARSRR